MLSGPRPRLDKQDSVDDAEVLVARDDVDVIGLYLLVVRDFANRKRSGSSQDLRQSAFMLRIQVLDQHVGHSRVGRQGGEQMTERIEAASRSPDTDDRERRVKSASFPCGFNSLRGSPA